MNKVAVGKGKRTLILVKEYCRCTQGPLIFKVDNASCSSGSAKYI